jgi:serine protease inhibitor
MNRSLTLGSLFLLMGVAGCDSGRVEPSSTKEVPAREEASTSSKHAVAEGINTFGFDLYHQLQSQQGNLFFSPYSISTALSMTYAGAKGETAREMAHVLHLNPDQSQLHLAIANLSGDLAGQANGVQLDLANSLWGQKGQPFVPSFIQLNKQYYGAGFHEIDFSDTEAARQEINAWVEKQTQDKIKDLLGPNSLLKAKLVLANAIYFKGSWDNAFSKARTIKENFFTAPDKSISVDMMHITTRFGYFEDDRFQILSMPYKGNAVSLIAFLPRQKDGLKALEGMLNAGVVNEAVGKLGNSKVAVSFPKFKMTSSFDLKDVLAKMGMPTAFEDGKANFSGIVETNDLYLSKVVHKAYVDVNEEGTEAAAATGAVGARTPSPVERTPDFRADHPFVFAIRDNKSGGILFMGRVANPKE